MAVKKVRKLKFVGKLVIVIFIAILCLGILCLSSFFFCDKEVKKEKIKKVVEKGAAFFFETARGGIQSA